MRPPRVRRETPDAVRVEAEHRGCLVDPGSERFCSRREPPCQPRRVEGPDAGLLPDSAQIRRRVDLRADGVSVQPSRLVAEAPQLLGVFLEVGHLVLPGRDVEDADRLVARVDAELVDGCHDPGEVLPPELLEPLHLLREAREPVGEPMCQ